MSDLGKSLIRGAKEALEYAKGNQGNAIRYALPFEPFIPNQETINAMNEARCGQLKSFETVQAFMNALNNPFEIALRLVLPFSAFNALICVSVNMHGGCKFFKLNEKTAVISNEVKQPSTDS